MTTVWIMSNQNFWREKNDCIQIRGFLPCAFKTIILLKMLLLCYLFQSWWAKILLVNIWLCLNRKKSFLHVQNHSNIFWVNCQKREVKKHHLEVKTCLSTNFYLDTFEDFLRGKAELKFDSNIVITIPNCCRFLRYHCEYYKWFILV